MLPSFLGVAVVVAVLVACTQTLAYRHHIGCGECRRSLAVQRKVSDHHGDVGGASYSRSRERDVELTVGKYRVRQVDCNLLKGLPLGFV